MIHPTNDDTKLCLDLLFGVLVSTAAFMLLWASMHGMVGQ